MKYPKYPCPPGCVDHYTVEDTRNHETMPRAVTGADVYTGMPIVTSVWMEQRDTPEGWELVGVLEKWKGNDVEFNSYQLRELAHHMTEVADRMDVIIAARKEDTLADIAAADKVAMRAATNGHVTGRLAVTVTVTEADTTADI